MRKPLLVCILFIFVASIFFAVLTPVYSINGKGQKVALSLDTCSKKTRGLIADLSSTIFEPQTEIAFSYDISEVLQYSADSLYKLLIPSKVFKPPEA